MLLPSPVPEYSGRPQFRVGQAQIVALEVHVCVKLARQQTAAQSAKGQRRGGRSSTVRHELGLDLALE
jgi:hypothetical protein